jgi:hypothetical protein
MKRKNETRKLMKSEELDGMDRWACYYDGKSNAFSEVLKWIDELAQPNDNTARDTKSGSAGVP